MEVSSKGGGPTLGPQPDSGEGVLVTHARQVVRLFVAEEQPLLRQAYASLLAESEGIAVVGTAPFGERAALEEGIAASTPNVVLVGTRFLTPETIDGLLALRRQVPTTGFVLLSFAYDVRAITGLREFSKRSVAGCAYLLKHTIASVDQLAQVVISVAEGRVVIDPKVLDDLVAATEPRKGTLKLLSPREMEVLGWMSRGYRNGPIARMLHLEPKTVERHINNIYAKLGDCPAAKHPRVQAISTFLTAAGYRRESWDEGESDPLAGYDGLSNAPMFQASTTASSAMEGSRSLDGTSQAIATGPAILSKKRPAGRPRAASKTGLTST